MRYIGKSDNPRKRLAKHIREAKRTTVLHRLAWIKGLLDKGLLPELIVFIQIPYEEWPFVECFLISSLTNIGYNLTNMADGGLGGSTARGRKRSIEAKQNISNGLKKLYARDNELRESQRQKSIQIW